MGHDYRVSVGALWFARGYNMAMPMSWDDILSNPVAEVFKSDRRSRVWRIEAAVDGDDDAHAHATPLAAVPSSGAGGARALVVKRFEYSLLRQRVQWMLGAHPVQRERAMHEALARAGVTVAPIIAAGVTPTGVGLRAWLVQPMLGLSLHHVIRQQRSAPSSRRRVIVDAVADLIAALLIGGWFNRDMKASNIVIDQQHRAWLIDAGAVRRSGDARRATRDALTMLEVLASSAQRAGASSTDQRRCLRAIVARLRAAGGAPASPTTATLADAIAVALRLDPRRTPH